MPQKRKRSGPGFSYRDQPNSSTSSTSTHRTENNRSNKKKAYNQVYRVASKNLSGQGILLSCTQGRERKAALQFIDFLNDVADRIYPGVVPQPPPMQEDRRNKAASDNLTTSLDDDDELRNGPIASSSSSNVTNMTSLPGTVQSATNANESNTSPDPPASIKQTNHADNDDLEFQIAAEVRSIKSSERSSNGNRSVLERFRKVETDTECLVFISVALPLDPYVLVYAILEEVERTGEPRTRFVQRMTPIMSTCNANTEDLASHAQAILPKYFGSNPTDSKTFKIDPRIRSHSNLKRNDVIQVIATNIPTDEQGERIHKADLTNPDLWIVVEVLKNTAAIAVLNNYERFKKLNLQSVAEAANFLKAEAEADDTQAQTKVPLGAEAEHKDEKPETSTADQAQSLTESDKQPTDDPKPEHDATQTTTTTKTTTTATNGDDGVMQDGFRLF